MKITAEPRSDQWNYIDFIGGPRDFTIAGVTKSPAKLAREINARYDIALEGEERVWRPPATVIRLLVKVWETDDGNAWVGRRVRLYGDPNVTSPGGKGGIRVSHVSHITGAKTVELPGARGTHSQKHTVEPLPEVTNADRITSLRAEWKNADDARKDEITAEVAALRADEKAGA